VAWDGANWLQSGYRGTGENLLHARTTAISLHRGVTNGGRDSVLEARRPVSGEALALTAGRTATCALVRFGSWLRAIRVASAPRMSRKRAGRDGEQGKEVMDRRVWTRWVY
jgi:hypothetical protein